LRIIHLALRNANSALLELGYQDFALRAFKITSFLTAPLMEALNQIFVPRKGSY
jgi:hypothetical protein